MNNEKTLKTMADKVVIADKEAVKNNINLAYTEIVKDNTIAVIPEIVFVEYFLDFFKNIHNTSEKTLLLKWLELAGGPYNEVNVIDGEGKVIYTVPSVYIKPKIDENMNDVNFNNMASKYVMKTNRIKTEGVNYLKNELKDIDNMIKVDEKEMLEATNRWKAIFKRYEKPVTPITKVSNPMVTQTDTLSDELEYD